MRIHQLKTILYCIAGSWVQWGIGYYMNSDKKKGQDGVIKHLNQVDQFIYIGSNISSIKGDDNTRIGKTFTAIDWLKFI